MSAPWTGPPRWNGKKVDIDLKNALMPVVRDELFLIQLENCNNFFVLLFREEPHMRQVMAYLQKKIGFATYSVKQVTEPKEFMGSIIDLGFRIMLDPQIINDHHTKWLEVIRDGDEILFYNLENN